MYFSKLKLRKDYNELEDFNVFITKYGYDWHRLLWTLDARNDQNKKRDFLYYIDEKKSEPIILLYSERKPVDTRNFWIIDYINGVKEFNPNITENSYYTFEIRVYPRIVEKNKEGKVVAYKDVVQDSIFKNYRQIKMGIIKKDEIIQQNLLDWISKKGSRLGFEILKLGIESIKKNILTKVTFKDLNNRELIFTSVDLKGILKVSDTEKFKFCLFKGFGAGKAFGCGMLRIVPCHPNTIELL